MQFTAGTVGVDPDHYLVLRKHYLLECKDVDNMPTKSLDLMELMCVLGTVFELKWALLDPVGFAMSLLARSGDGSPILTFSHLFKCILIP